MKILIFGSGGVGGYYGARLQQAGHEVTFVARGAHAAAMRAKGLRIQSQLGDATLQVKVVEKPEPAELIVVSVKLWDTEATAALLKPVVNAQTSVISLQNGVDKDEIFGAALGADRIVGGVTHIGATIAEPGVIAHTGKLARVTVGELKGGTSERVDKIAAAFTEAGVETKVSDDMRRTTWEKFCFLTPFAGLTALTRKPIGLIRENPDTRAFLHDALKEAVQVARAEGAPLLESYEPTTIAQFDAAAPNFMSSMSQDLLRGGRLELPWLSGAIVRRAAKHGIPVPTHRAIQAALVLYEQGDKK
jgi:2-dehydropantoate 2-reductase